MAKGLKLEGFTCRSVQAIDLAAAPGQILGLTGPSGTGKSLFLRAMADIDPHEGRMLLDGVDANTIPAPQWRRQVGLLPAESAWWFDTVGEHFDQVPPDWLEKLGFGRQTFDWQISHLSSGERQRLALLRLLVNEPRVLLLDEPTANLDTVNTRRVESLLKEYHDLHQPIMLWVSHDLDQLKRWCSPILILNERRFDALDASPAGPVAPPLENAP